MVKIKILSVKNRDESNVEISALLSKLEFKQLSGNLDNLCVFSPELISVPASYVKTGAKHAYTKYLLFPVKLRRNFKIEDFDFDNLKCGCVEYGGMVFVVYGVERKKGIVLSKEKSNH